MWIRHKKHDVDVECRHDMRPSVQLPRVSGSGADTKLRLTLGNVYNNFDFSTIFLFSSYDRVRDRRTGKTRMAQSTAAQ